MTDREPCPKEVVLAVERSRENRARIMATEESIQELKVNSALIKAEVKGIKGDVEESNKKLDLLLDRGGLSTPAKLGIGGGSLAAIIAIVLRLLGLI